MFKEFKSCFFLLCLFAVSIIPAFGALDKAATQWLYLSILVLIFTLTTNLDFKNYFRSNFTKSYLLFVLLALFSLSYTNNISISLVDLSRHITVILLSVISFSIFKTNSISFFKISALIAAFLLYESVMSLKPLLNYIYAKGFEFSTITSVDIDHFKGVTGNRNITTASLVCKMPFVFYILYKTKKTILSVFAVLCLFASSLVLFIITSRAALVSLSLYIFLLFLYSIFKILNTKHLKFFLKSILILVVLIFSYVFSRTILPSNANNAAERLTSIEITNQSSSNRFILWENAYDFISKNPLLGCGIGNWKVESSAYWSNIGASYLVPFHAHNDFLEFTTELGLFGGLTYLAIFLFLFLFFFKKLMFKNNSNKSIFLLLVLTGLFVDSFFNFPFERPIMQVLFVLILSFGANLHNQNTLRDEI